ncbi:MAG TPA: hypothetical protein VF857_05620 [Spirochaetota bacterium]
MKKIIILALFPLVFMSCSDKKENENQFSVWNIISASLQIAKEKGIGSISSEEISRKIEEMYRSPDEILQKPSTLRQQDDGANNYGIIFEERIREDNYQAARNRKDFFKEKREK